MQLYQNKLTLPGALPGPENPQPTFRSLEKDMKMEEDGTLTKEQKYRYGTDCGARCLPYRMQDRYLRSDEPVTLDTVVMENRFIRAEFVPSLGGRLWSLYDKEEQREVLFRNPVLRIANLAIRNAWFSGGIEWNLGHTGHHVFTCDSVYACVVKAPDGEEFLRMYQYEAEHAQVYQMDFHLPEDSRQLVMHLRIENTLDSTQPLYWWTNTAVPQTEGTRIFSATDKILYQTMSVQETLRPPFGLETMPFQKKSLPGVDVSYPARIPRSTEYFFQNSTQMAAPWEVSTEPDGRGFLERSTQPLHTRKLFCWGNRPGGVHWSDYLSRPGEGSYVEIQAGLAPTQVHTVTIEGHGVVEFTQMFGAFTAQPQAVNGDWADAQKKVADRVDEIIDIKRLQMLDQMYAAKAEIPGETLLSLGDRRGGLERLRMAQDGEENFAPHLEFPAPQKEKLSAWANLLRGEMLPESGMPLPYMTDPRWLPYLESLCTRTDVTGQAQFQLAVSLAENDREAEAVPMLEKLTEEGDAWAAHALGMLARRSEQAKKAEYWLLKAFELEQTAGGLDVSFAQDALEQLVKNGRYEKAWEFWNQLPESLRSDRSRLDAAEAAVKTGHLDFAEECFKKEYACIREGAVGLADVWFEYLARRSCAEKGIEFDPSYIDDTLPMPKVIDFRMY